MKALAATGETEILFPMESCSESLAAHPETVESIRKQKLR